MLANIDIPILLADGVFQAFVAIVLFGISIAGWIGNLVKQKQERDLAARRKQRNQARAQAGGKENEAQSEVQQFLQALAGETPATNKPAQRQNAPQRPPAKRRRPPQRAQKTEGQSSPTQKERSEARRRKNQSQAKQAEKRPAAPVAKRRKASETSAVQQNLAAAILASGNGPIPEQGVLLSTSVKKKPISPLLKDLRDPEMIRKAMIFNEVFKRPKSQRGPDDSLI